ncbi:NAD(P)-dependent oxidoreductase [Candidatus Saccharibacteria bacterium]|nr:NAD(P)-dependent oxidoreductase [Candidatus Saccharibacteria bacterium]MCA9328540.1 NAD(P)-dependent oxidoreductase [Candidatus Saccharibacteria bacterium]
MNKVLLVGSEGFIGRHVAQELAANGYKVIGTTRKGRANSDKVTLDALDFDQTCEVIRKLRPNYIVNCAGVLENSEAASANVIISMNLLRSVYESGVKLEKCIVTGSAAEYGIVKKLPVAESDPVIPTSEYGRQKHEEVVQSLEYGKEKEIPVVVARVFNPIGRGMAERQLIPSLLRQLKTGSPEVEVSRADSKRDYIDIRDVAVAYRLLLEPKKLNHRVYNVGSGVSTSNRRLVELLVESMNVEMPKVVEKVKEAEPMVASQADVSRITSDLQWKVKHSLEETIREIVSHEPEVK